MSSFFSFQNDYFSKKVYYLLCLERAEGYKKAQKEQEKIQDMGGAGYIYTRQGSYYIVAFIYKTYADAQSVGIKHESEFSNYQILDLETSRIKRRVKNAIMQEKFLFNSYKTFFKVIETIYALCEKYNKETSYSSVVKELEKLKIKLEDSLHALNNIENNEIKNTIYLSLKVMLGQIEQTKKSLYEGGDILQNMRLTLVNLCFEEVSLRKMLNNI